MKNTHKEFVKYFIMGYLNEYHVNVKCNMGDNYISYKSFKMTQTTNYLGLPRPNIKYDKAIFQIISFFEIFISIFILIFKLIDSTIQCLITKKVNLKGCIIIPGLDIQPNRLDDMLKCEDYRNLKILKIPYIHNRYNKNVISLFSGANILNVFCSFYLALFVVIHIKSKYKKRDFLFRSYASFEYFLLCFYVKNSDLSNEYIYYSLIDRWAFLFCNDQHNNTLIQHGKLMEYLKLIKIGSPHKVYFINSKQKLILEKILFKTEPHISLLRPNLNITSSTVLIENGKGNVLLICCLIFIENEKKMIELLSKIETVNLYIKPHPGDKDISVYNTLNKSYDFRILEKEDYPNVDYVVSYDSTLADEYENIGKHVLRYNDSEFDESFLKMFNINDI